MSLEELLGHPSLFHALPADWHVIVVDIEKSTEAVERGLHQDVNLVATGSIVTVLNQIKNKHPKLKIPYFFGGDGATFLVPDSILEELRIALDNYSKHVQKNFQLVLRVGTMPVSELYAKEIQLYIAKLKLNRHLTIPVILGNGLRYAEKTIKARYRQAEEKLDPSLPLDLEGMQCRWNEIEPPVEEEKIVCLLVSCVQENLQAVVYQGVIAEIDRLFGGLEERQPIVAQQLNLNLAVAKVRKEMYARLGKYDLIYLLKNWLATVIGKYYYFEFSQNGKNYLDKVSKLSTTLMLDGNINSVISGTQSEIDALLAYLDTQEQAGKLIYGVHVTHSSIMSCYVLDHKSNHVHFVDGTEGGYTTAAKMFKLKAVLG